MFTETTPLMPMSSFMPTLEMQKSVSLPVSTVAKHYNAALDCFFYDVSSLTTAEYFALVQETNIEGSILVVLPRDPSGKGRVRKFGDMPRCAPRRDDFSNVLRLPASAVRILARRLSHAPSPITTTNRSVRSSPDMAWPMFCWKRWAAGLFWA